MERRTIKQLSARVPKEKKKGAWKKWLVLVPLFLTIGGVIYFVNLPQYQIEKVVVEGALLSKDADIESLAQESLAGNYFLVIPKTFFWVYPKGEIVEKVESLPSILNSTLSLDTASKTLTITTLERKQEYVWCSQGNAETASSTKSTDSKGDCFYMDKAGLVFVPAPEFTGHVFLTFRGILENESPIGKHYLPEDKMENLLGFIEKIRPLGLEASRITAKTSREIHVVLKSGTDLIVSLESPLAPVAKSVATLMQSNDFKVASGGIDKISYIDLRYGSKAFWK